MFLNIYKENEKVKLSPAIRERIKSWLKLDNKPKFKSGFLDLNYKLTKGDKCPFSFGGGSSCYICASVFKRVFMIKNSNGSSSISSCPCRVYTLKYVIKKAKEVLNAGAW